MFKIFKFLDRQINDIRLLLWFSLHITFSIIDILLFCTIIVLVILWFYIILDNLFFLYMDLLVGCA